MEIITGKLQSAQKIIVYGPEGIGKSTFASHFPNPLFIDTEGSTKHMDVARMPKASSWTMLLEQIRYIKANPSLCKTLVIDTIDWAEHLCVDHICSRAQPPKDGIEGFGYGKGYVYLAEEFGRLLNLLEEIIESGINVVLTAHAKINKFEQPDEMGSYDRWEMKMQKYTTPLVKEWADMVLFANYKTYVVNVDGQGASKGKNKAQGGARVMYTTHHSCWDAKNRHDLVPELPFEFAQISHCLSRTNSSSVPVQTAPPVQNPIQTSMPPIQQAQTPVSTPSTEKQPIDNSIISDTVQIYPPVDDTPAPIPPDTLEGIPKALADLMTANSVTEADIRQAVYNKSYYPLDTPIRNYDPNFINGVLVGAWPQVFQMIQENKKLPF